VRRRTRLGRRLVCHGGRRVADAAEQASFSREFCGWTSLSYAADSRISPAAALVADSS